jgi:hypothetical protein
MNKNISFILIISLAATSCVTKDYSKVVHDPVLYSQTVKKLNDIVLENNFPPMIASRNYAYAAIAGYEVVAASDSNYISLAGQIKHMPPMPKPDASKKIDFPFASMLAFCKVGNAVTFPEGSMDDYVKGLKEKVKDAGMPSSVFNNSVEYGNRIADTILSWSKKDNYAELRSAPKYTVTNEPGSWVPTPPGYFQATEPHWKEMRTLILDSCSECKPAAPPAFLPEDKKSQFCKEMMIVKNTGDSLTDEQKWIADFWDDNPFKLNVVGHVMYATKKFSPPGHWMNIVGIIAQEEHADFATTVRAYAETSVALYDGFISAWDEKFRSNYVRPITVINKYMDPEWQPYIQTPPFPEYVSAHSVVSAAAAEVMTHIFGDNISYRDTSETEFGIPARTFKSVRSAAVEAAISRLYGGIHYKNSCVVGTTEGVKVGELVVQRLHMTRNDLLSKK